MIDERTRMKKIRKTLIVMWGMLFCMNLIICLVMTNPKPINWIIAGVPFGVVVILLSYYPLENSLDELIKLQENLIDKLMEKNPTKKKK